MQYVMKSGPSQSTAAIIKRLMDRERPRPRSYTAIAADIALERGRSLSPQRVGRDVAYFKQKANMTSFVVPMPELLESPGPCALSPGLARQIREVSTLGEFVRLVEGVWRPRRS
jgi:hypothetical protein